MSFIDRYRAVQTTRTVKETYDTVYTYRLTRQLKNEFIKVCKKNEDIPSELLRDFMDHYIRLKG